MNGCCYEQLNAMAVGCEERERERRMRMVDSVVCPKPRRLCLLNPSFNDPIKSSRFSGNTSYSEMADSGAGAELLDIILTKGGYGGDQKTGYQVPSSPPFYCGSPPSRASNPVIQDAQFCNEKGSPSSTAPPSPSSTAPPSPSSRKGGGGGCARMKFGNIPAAVRVEGFDCLSRDGRNCSISAVA